MTDRRYGVLFLCTRQLGAGHPWWSMPVAVGIGVPRYAGAATLIPVVQPLLNAIV